MLQYLEKYEKTFTAAKKKTLSEPDTKPKTRAQLAEQKKKAKLEEQKQERDRKFKER